MLLTTLSGHGTLLPGQCQGFELFGKTDQAIRRCIRGRGFGHLAVFARPFAKLICREEIERHMISHQTLSPDPVKLDLFAGISSIPRLRVTVNPCHCQ
jgi:hypothetical protein